MKLVTLGSRRNNKVKIMKTKTHKAVGVCRAIKTLLLIGGVALACASSSNATISTGTITLNGDPSSSLVITEGVVVALSATFTDTVPTNNDGAVVVWSDGTTNIGTVALANLGSNITVTASHQYATTTVAPATASVTVTNGIGVSSGAFTISSLGDVVDAPLTVVATGPGSVIEGNLASNVTLLTFIDGNPLATTNQYGPVVHSELITPPGGVFTQAYSIVSLGTSNGGALFAVQGSLEYAAVGSNTILITVNDLGGSSISGTGTVDIADAPLALVSTGTLAFTEGEIGSTNVLVTFLDSNLLANASSIAGYVAVVNWGDGSPSQTFSNDTFEGPATDSLGLPIGAITIQDVVSNTFEVVGDHAYPSNGTYFVTVTVNDIGGAPTLTASGIPDDVADAGLTIVNINSSLTSLPGFEPLSQFSGNSLGEQLVTFTDSNEFSRVNPIAAQPYTEYLATINWGDGSATSTGIVQDSGQVIITANPNDLGAVTTNGVFFVYGNHTFDAVCTNYTMVLKVLDLGGNAFAVATTSVIVADAPIVGNGYTVNAAANNTFSGTVAAFSDPDTALSGSSFTATINWGDGTPFTTGTVVADGTDVYVVQGSHTYVGAPLANETVTVTVSDSNPCGSPVTLPTTTISFTGASPGISFLYGLLSNYITVATDTSFTTNLATFTDSSLPPGDAFDLAALINWGDGTASDGNVTTNAANEYVVTGTHTYSDDGAYHVSVEVEDVDTNHNTLSNITIVAESPITDLTSSMEVLFSDVVVKQYKSGGASVGEDYYYSEVVTLKNISGTTLSGPFGLVFNTDAPGANNLNLLSITGQLADGREYIPLSVDTLKSKATLKVTVQWTDQALLGRGPVILPVRLIAGPGL
jgi:large repetitive protein